MIYALTGSFSRRAPCHASCFGCMIEVGKSRLSTWRAKRLAAEHNVRFTGEAAMIKALPLVLLAALLADFGSARGQSFYFPDADPGDLVLGYHQTWYWPPSIYLCPAEIFWGFGEFWVWGIAPEVPVAGVRFNVLSSWGGHEGGVVLDGAVDLTPDEDNYWDLDFNTCREWAPGVPVKLVHYFTTTPPDESVRFWICLSGPDNITVEWTTCDGETIAGGIYPPEGQLYPEGCFSADPWYCAIDAPPTSWTSLKARY